MGGVARLRIGSCGSFAGKGFNTEEARGQWRRMAIPVVALYTGIGRLMSFAAGVLADQVHGSVAFCGAGFFPGLKVIRQIPLPLLPGDTAEIAR
jgi:hypothetical protein